MKTTLTLLLAAVISTLQARNAVEPGVKAPRGAITTTDRREKGAAERAAAVLLAANTNAQVETNGEPISPESRAQGLESSATAAEQVADGAEADCAQRRAEDERTIAELQAELARTKSNDTLACSDAGSQSEAVLRADLEKARAEIARLNDLNLDQQAELDALRPEKPSNPGLSSEGREGGAASVPGSDAARARRAPLIVKGASSRALVFYTDRLAAALARRDQMNREVARLEASPAADETPRNVSKLRAELSMLEETIARLAALVAEGSAHGD